MSRQKDELRDKYRAVRLGMAHRDVARKSRTICNRLLKDADWSKIKSAHIYKSIVSLNEVETKRSFNQLVECFPDMKIVLGGNSKTEALPRQKFDLIIVPCLAFDKANHRLGWGGGWYDRFLAQQPQALKIGLGFANGLVSAGIPAEPHDVPLDKIISEV